MASIIRIKRSSTAGDPTTLGSGELAYSALSGTQANGGDRLYVGFGTETAGNAANHYVVGGKYFTDLLDHVHGTVTASSAVLVDASKKVDEWNVDNITINGNTISSTDTNGNLLLDPDGAGYVSIVGTNGLVIPVGTTGQRGPSVQGTVRYNSDTSQFEGYNGTNWTSLGGVRSVDGYTYITAESTVGASDGILHFYVENAAGNGTTEVAQLNNAKLNILANTGSTSTTTGALVVAGGAGIAENLYIGGAVVITGNLTVNGTTTTVNSTTVTIDDPVFTLGGDAAPATDDNKDRGIEFRWHNGTTAKLGFFGFDDSTGYFTFIPDATDTSSVYSGTKGILDVTSITGTAASWTTSRTVTFATGDTTGSFTLDGTADVSNVVLTTQTATTSVKGIASFNTANFIVTSGDVTIKEVDGGTY